MRLFLWLLQLLLALLLVLIRLILPFLLMALRGLRGLVLISFTATVNGPTRFIDRLAGEWTERVHEGADNREHLFEVFQLCRFLIGAIIVLGWLVATFVTVEMLRVVFGFFI